VREAAERIDQPPHRGGPEQGISGGYAYFKGAIVPFGSAQVSIATHALHYGTGCFEGIRGYWNPEHEELYLVKVREHFQRFLKSARLLKLELTESLERLSEVTLEVVRRDAYRQDVYVRPIAFMSSPLIKIDLHSSATAVGIFAFPLGEYSSISGLRLTVSSWRRVSDNSIPARAKITGSYVNTALAVEDAQAAGFDDCLMLTEAGHVAEASAANFFMVEGQTLVTSPVSDDILVGLTRAAVIRLAREMELRVMERPIDRSEVYQADEAFLCGTGVQVAPILSIDGRDIGSGRPGPITTRLQEAYFRAVRGDDPRYQEWLTPVYQ
jgi:branched-chain amino acid aminotransferase